MSKNITAALWVGGVLAMVILVLAIKLDRDEVEEMQINSFEECVEAGNPVAESYPRQCNTPDGGHFVEEITPAPTPTSTPTTTSQKGTIVGTVTLGPTCPGPTTIPPRPGCEDKPYETKFVLTEVQNTQVIREFSSNSRGEFTIDVPKGTYIIRRAASTNILPSCSNTQVTVLANKSVSVAISCDTGMR
jgi:hypothetical protein